MKNIFLLTIPAAQHLGFTILIILLIIIVILTKFRNKKGANKTKKRTMNENAQIAMTFFHDRLAGKRPSDPKIVILLLLVSNFANAQSNPPEFAKFLVQFPKASLPYDYSRAELVPKVGVKSIRVASFLSGEETRFDSIALIAEMETDKYVAVLYRLSKTYLETKINRLRVFSKEGDCLATKLYIKSDRPLTACDLDVWIQKESSKINIIGKQADKANFAGPVAAILLFLFFLVILFFGSK